VLVSGRARPVTRHRIGAAVGATIALLGAVSLLVALTRDGLPSSLGNGASPAHVALTGPPVMFGSFVLAALLLAVASAGFARRADADGDRFLALLAGACALGAASRVAFALFPSAFSDWVSVGEVLSLAFWLAAAAAAVVEMETQRRAAIGAATLEERRRIARDYHDGLAQELASVHRNLRWLDASDPFVARATASADRAMRDARRAIAALSDAGEARPLADVLEDVAAAIGEREGSSITLDLDRSLTVEPEAAHALAQIAAEAMTNASRHAGTGVVHLSLRTHDGVELRISDAGRGIPAERMEGGFGIRSMAERALAVGGQFSVDSEPGAGTRIDVKL
jgi:signal transduction histidine kinase